MGEKIKKSELFAQRIYHNKQRLSGESVYSHVLNVRSLLEKVGVRDENVLIATVLHHVISENMQGYMPEIKKEFGTEVSEILSHFEKISNLQIKIDSPKNLNKEYITQTYLNLSHDQNVLIILLADKVEGSKTLYALDPEKRKSSSNRCLYIYAPICRLVGLNEFASEMEKNAFQMLYTGEYFKIENMLRDRSIITKNYLKNIKYLITDYLKENRINCLITYRIKSEYSIFNKYLTYKKVNKKTTYNDVHDVAAMRIVVESEEQCYLVEDLLKKIWQVDETQRDDYITNPRPNGYKSLHNLFFIEKEFPLEIQIRTNQMHEENEYGNSSHIFYKYGDKFIKYLRNNPDWLKTLNFKKAEEVSELQHFSDKVYTFTPKGDIIELPRGASILDFAYALHEDLGNRCVSGLVNEEIKKLSYILQDGERIEIGVTNKLNVNRDWLEYVITRQAKKSIKKVLRTQNSK